MENSAACSFSFRNKLDIPVRKKRGVRSYECFFGYVVTRRMDTNINERYAVYSNAHSKGLKRRFEELPIHRICYYHSDHPTEVALEKLRKTIASGGGLGRIGRMRVRIAVSGNHRDRFGMTPLHILACSTKHDPDLYKLLIEAYPRNLVTKDDCDNLPIAYALMSNAPPAVIRMLVEMQQALLPGHTVDWVGVVGTLGRAPYFPGVCGWSLFVRNLLETQRAFSPGYLADWQAIMTEWASQDMKWAKESRVQNYFDHNTFQYLIKFSILERLDSIGEERWRKDILSDIERLCWYAHCRKESTEAVFSKLSRYEHLKKMKDATSLLELALWKARIDSRISSDHKESKCHTEEATTDGIAHKVDCLIRCGAIVVVPNVLSFLKPV